MLKKRGPERNASRRLPLQSYGEARQAGIKILGCKSRNLKAEKILRERGSLFLS